jgi:metallo-beta-lactamase family protein
MGSDPAGSDPSFTRESLEIVVDSPLAAEFPRIYRDLKPYWGAIARYIS